MSAIGVFLMIMFYPLIWPAVVLAGVGLVYLIFKVFHALFQSSADH